ncbi:glycosyltransferase family 2 protein, partial [Natrinema sp. JCM 9743]
MAQVSVIIPTLRDESQIEVLDALERQTLQDFEVLIQTEKNASKARNVGVSSASSEKLIFLDDDSEPAKTHLEVADKTLEHHSLVAGRIISNKDGVLGDLSDHYDHGNKGKYVDMATGCNMAIHRKVFDTIGGFDENLAWGHEESDLVKRAKQNGYDVWYEPNMVVDHQYVDSIPDFFRKKWTFGREAIYYHRKHDYRFADRLRKCIPLAPGSGSISEFIIQSLAKGVWGSAQIYELLFGDIPDHQQAKDS